MIVVWVNDLFFGSNIETEARALHAACCFVDTPQDAVKAVEENDASLALIDLNVSEKVLETIRSIKITPSSSHIRIIGFISDVETDLAQKAQIAGCDVVMPRSLFAKSLPEIFHRQREYELSAVLV
ncbi:MAG: hypothetical protein HZC17_03030 [Candidatus Omnitrophica bacterium]|nr:hypothetical protein [Candidatus Omnitrophota bacterium]